ncbi:MAG: hypothetical protein B6D65_03930 [candidate division Zixibacteria bacterium 4484_93]|nr:MAG: hypothetical protein B6D65_03930 [candidate division Zixibacteria bacterium 4484_93]
MVKRLSVLLFFLFLSVELIAQADTVVYYGGSKGQMDIGLKSAGVKLGVVLPTGGDYDPNIKIAGFVDLGYLVPNLKPELFFEYWKVKRDEYGWSSADDDVKFSCIGGGASLKYLFDFHPRLKPFVGAGLGFNHYKTDYPKDWPQGDETETPFELHIDFGANLVLGEKFYAILSGKYNLSDIDNIDMMLGLGYNIVR